MPDIVGRKIAKGACLAVVGYMFRGMVMRIARSAAASWKIVCWQMVGALGLTSQEVECTVSQSVVKIYGGPCRCTEQRTKGSTVRTTLLRSLEPWSVALLQCNLRQGLTWMGTYLVEDMEGGRGIEGPDKNLRQKSVGPIKGIAREGRGGGGSSCGNSRGLVHKKKKKKV